MCWLSPVPELFCAELNRLFMILKKINHHDQLRLINHALKLCGVFSIFCLDTDKSWTKVTLVFRIESTVHFALKLFFLAGRTSKHQC